MIQVEATIKVAGQSQEVYEAIKALVDAQIQEAGPEIAAVLDYDDEHFSLTLHAAQTIDPATLMGERDA